MFKIHTDVTLSMLKDQLDQINDIDTRRVDIVDYRRPSIDSTETMRFNQMKFTNNDNVGTIFSIFGYYNTK